MPQLGHMLSLSVWRLVQRSSLAHLCLHESQVELQTHDNVQDKGDDGTLGSLGGLLYLRLIFGSEVMSCARIRPRVEEAAGFNAAAEASGGSKICFCDTEM